MDFKNKMLSEMSDRKGQIVYDSIYMKFLEQSIHRQKVEWWLPEAEGRKNGELLFNGDIILALQDEKMLEVDDGDGYTMLWMYLMLLNCMLKTVTMGLPW